MSRLDKAPYFERLLDYYYDHVHWAEELPPSVYTWAKETYGADIARFGNFISFDNDCDRTAFLLRWS